MHRKASLPPPFTEKFAVGFPQGEADLVKSISAARSHENFGEIFYREVERLDLGRDERKAWLRCMLYFVKMDTNKNGIPDWTAIVDDKPARVLFPLDKDV